MSINKESNQENNGCDNSRKELGIDPTQAEIHVASAVVLVNKLLDEGFDDARHLLLRDEIICALEEIRLNKPPLGDM